MTSSRDLIARAIQLLKTARYTIALTGAGISTPSGLPDFRSQNSGLWAESDPFLVASLYAFRRQPEAFYDWIYPLAQSTARAIPNPAHIALASLERQGRLMGVITQNFDMLHHRAGSKNVYEIHGHMRQMTCLRCYGEVDSAPYIEHFLETREMPRCACGGVLKPNIILFGEQLPVQTVSAAKQHTRASDLMLVVGSSLQVAPAGDLPALAKSTGSQIIIVNNEPTPADEFADVVIHADVVEILPLLAEPFLREPRPSKEFPG